MAKNQYLSISALYQEQASKKQVLIREIKSWLPCISEMQGKDLQFLIFSIKARPYESKITWRDWRRLLFSTDDYLSFFERLIIIEQFEVAISFKEHHYSTSSQ